MPLFELEANSKTYEIEAPDMDTAARAFHGLIGQRFAQKPVTDPALLRQLNGEPAPGQPVTDPDLLRQLNGDAPAEKPVTDTPPTRQTTGQLADFRKQYPDYADISDADLANALHRKFYSDIPRDEFNRKIGLGRPAYTPPTRPVLSDDPRDWEAQRKQQSKDDIAYHYLLAPAAKTVGGDIVPALPGLIHEPIEAVRRILARGPVHPGEVDSSLAADALTAGGAAMPATRMPYATREAVAAANAAEAASSKAFGPQVGGTGLPERWAGIMPEGPSAGAEAAAAGQRQGVDVPRFVATDSVLAQKVAGGLKDTPVLGDQITKASRDMAESLGRRSEGIADTVSPGGANPQGAGSVARDAMTEWISGSGQGTSAGLMRAGYDVLDTKIKPDALVPLNRTRIAALAMKADDVASATPDGQKIIGIVQEALRRPEGLTYDGLKTLRTRIGDKLDQSLEPGVSGKLLNRIYGSLSDDLRFAAERAGVAKRGGSGKAALDAFDAATTKAREVFGQRAELGKIVGSKGDATGAEVFDRLMALAGSTSRGDVGRLALAKRAMGDEAWREVAAARIRAMGLDKADNFSPTRFVTEYANKRVPEDAKTILFGRETKAALDDIHTLSKRWDEVQRYGNPSGSGRSIAVASALMAAWAHPLLLAAQVATGYGLGKLLSRPTSARATARYMQAYTQRATKPSPATETLVAQTARSLAGEIADQTGEDAQRITDHLNSGGRRQ